MGKRGFTYAEKSIMRVGNVTGFSDTIPAFAYAAVALYARKKVSNGAILLFRI